MREVMIPIRRGISSLQKGLGKSYYKVYGEKPHFYNGLRAGYRAESTSFPPGFSTAFGVASAAALFIVYCCHADERRKVKLGKVLILNYSLRMSQSLIHI